MTVRVPSRFVCKNIVEINYDNGKKNFLIAAEGLKVGDNIRIGTKSELINGNILPLEDIPVGTSIFNIESIPGDGGKFVRSAGGYAKVISKKGKEVLIQLPSKKQKSFNSKCRASIGVIAGSGRREKPFLKAGKRYHYMRSRNKLYPQISGQKSAG